MLVQGDPESYANKSSQVKLVLLTVFIKYIYLSFEHLIYIFNVMHTCILLVLHKHTDHGLYLFCQTLLYHIYNN